MNAQRPIARRRADTGSPEWLTLGQAATYLGVAQSTLRKWSDDGRLTAFYTPGGHRRFRLDELRTFVESSRPAAAAARAAGPLVLIVDDDARLREFLRVNLEHAGYAVGEAANGPEALAAIADDRPDLVLLDVVMPGIDGWQILQRLEERHGSIPVIMFSGQIDEQAAAAAAEGGARGFVGKPFDPQELLARARQLVPA
jgi:excisionase family DNA binding protein